MENLEKKQIVDITLRKIFDMKMKQGHEMRKATVDESEFLRTFYFLKGTKVYVIDISSKKIEELDFTRGKEVVFISGNSNNEHLIIVLKNGNIYAIDNDHNAKHIKNLIVNSVLFENKKVAQSKDAVNNTFNLENFRLFCSSDLSKLVISNENFMTIWYQNEQFPGSSQKTNNFNIKKSYIEELTGTFYNISLENEKKIFLSPDIIQKKNYFEKITVYFGNNYFLGSFGKIIYILLVPTDIKNLFKIILIDYIFKYESSNKIKAVSESTSNINPPSQRSKISTFTPNTKIQGEYVRNIEKKTVYSYLNYSTEISKENNIYCQNKDRIILKMNTAGNFCAIMLNCQYALTSNLMIYCVETCKFSIYKMFNLFTKIKQPKNDENKMFIWVEDLDWICNDLFLVLVLSQGYFVILNIEFQPVCFIDSSNSLINSSNNVDYISCPSYIFNQKLKLADRLQLITSKKRTDYFIIYTNNYSICFQTNQKSYESRLLMVKSIDETFADFLYTIKYFQIYHSENDTNGLFDKIHNYMVKCLKELYYPDSETNMPHENVSHIFSIFVKFIRIFRSLNQIHETNLTILSYMIGVSNDFFYHLINFKEIWLAFIFIDICENYLLKHIRLKISRNKLSDDQLAKGQTSYIALNPYFQHNPSLKCYNKIINRVLFSRLRLILIFFALVEFRNNQALNINVLYFILAKLCIEKLKKHNFLDDIQLMVKVVIRNWKFLKTENTRAGTEEYILNGLTMNIKTEIMSQFIHSRNPREDIKFDFFGDFLPFDELQNFSSKSEAYCRGEEEKLIEEYNYIYNIGIIQRWILFFTNYLYTSLFEEVKNYMNNHVKQSILQKKEEENIPPEETFLASLIYFNFTFFILCLNNYVKFFLKFFISKTETSNEFSFIADDTKILSEFTKIYLPFISPVEIPFTIFEFYTLEDNKMKKNLPYEININLNNLIIRSFKNYNIAMYDTIDFIEFLMNSGFKSYEVENPEDDTFENNMNNTSFNNREPLSKLQKYIYSAFIFYLFTMHKLNQLHFLETDRELILSIIDNMNITIKSECYEILFIIFNGQLRYFLQKETAAKLSLNNAKYLEIILNSIKLIFYKIVREEPFYVRRNIYEYVYITPSVMKSYLLEGAIFYEYKNLNKYVKDRLFDCKNLLDINNYSCITNSGTQNTNKKNFNIFEEIVRNNKNPTIEAIFNGKSCLNKMSETDIKTFRKNISYSIKNIILLSKIFKNDKAQMNQTSLIFSLETNRDYIKKIIFAGVSEKVQENLDEKMSNELFFSIVDKIVKGNFDNKNVFKFSNIELKMKLIKSIKLAILKFLHLFNILFIKYKSFSNLDINKDTLGYLMNVSYCLLFSNEEKCRDNFSFFLQIIECLFSIKTTNFKEQERNSYIEIIRNILIMFIKYRKNLNHNNFLTNLQEKIKKENKEIETKLQSLITDEIPKLKLIYDNLQNQKSNNLKMILILSYSDYYWGTMLSVYSQVENYAQNQNTKMPMKNARRKYIKMSDSFAEMTGLPIKSFIDFSLNWELINDDELYNFVVSDESAEDRQLDITKIDDEQNTNIIMNRRQRYGNDTPKRQNVNVNFILPNNAVYNNYVSPNLNSSFSKDLNRSIDLREETDNSSQDINKNKASTSIKIKSKKKKANLPKYGGNVRNKLISNPDDKVDDNKSIITIIKKSETKDFKSVDQDNKSTNTILEFKKANPNSKEKFENEDDVENIDENKDDNLSQFANKIKKIFFLRFKSNVFLLYKEQIAKKELEEIKIYNIKPKEGSVEVIVLKEKYVPNKEFEEKTNMNQSYVSDNKKSGKNNQNLNISITNSELHDNSVNEGNKNETINIKPFDIININKFKSGKGDNSAIYKDLLMNKKRSNIQSTIKNKIEEIQEKLKKYEEMAMNLGKEFTNTFNK